MIGLHFSNILIRQKIHDNQMQALVLFAIEQVAGCHKVQVIADFN